jgi:predicted acyltransferase
MLLVNDKALGPWTPSQLTHGGWSGRIHLADFVYPWFLLIVGVAIPFSSRAGLSRWGHFARVLKRAVMLVLLGCLINSSYARRPLFDLGVLQLIGFAYFGGALLYAMPVRWRLGTAAGLLVAHWALLRFAPIPGFPGGPFTENQNVVTYLNQMYLERYGLENLPAALPTIALVLIGTGIGDLLRTESIAGRAKVRMILICGAAMVLTGWLWSLDLPFNKPLWTSPYILVTAGWGAMVLAALYHVTDVRGRRGTAFPLVVLGINAITAFVLPILVNIYILSEWGWTLPNGKLFSLGDAWFGFFTRPFGLGLGGLLYTLSYLLVWWLVLYWMYRKRRFLKV